MVPIKFGHRHKLGKHFSPAAPRLLCPQGFQMLSLSSSGGPTCAVRPLYTPEWLATSLHHLNMVFTAEGGPKLEKESREFQPEGSGHNPLSEGDSSTCAYRPLCSPGWLRYLPKSLGYSELCQRMVSGWSEKLEGFHQRVLGVIL